MDTFETQCRTNIEGARTWLAAYPTVIASMGTGVAAAEALGEACARLEAFTRQVEVLLAEREVVRDLREALEHAEAERVAERVAKRNLIQVVRVEANSLEAGYHRREYGLGHARAERLRRACDEAEGATT